MTKSKARRKVPLHAAVIKPLAKPVISRLDRHEGLLLELRMAADVTNKRISAIQFQLDELIASRNP